MNRRTFLSSTILASAGTVSRLPLSAQPDPAGTATLTLHPDRHVTEIPDDFNGLSYEIAQLSEPGFFSSKNKSLIALLRVLSPKGVLRIGGNSSEFCWWKTSESARAPEIQAPPGPRESNWMPHTLTPITPEGVDRLGEFLNATGWNLIYGLNLGTGTPERDADEAAYVAKVVGSRLQYFQIGNEPEYYREANNQLRPPSWDFAAYLTQWLQFAEAVSARAPAAKFGGPDVGSNPDWVAEFAKQAPERLKNRIVACTGHYYAEGPPDDPKVTTERLLRTNPKIAANMSKIMPAARGANLGFRMTEGNSCYRGGKPGMSNAFASALWAGDYTLHLAELGCGGVNLHGGSTKFIRISLGGHLPGELVSKDPNATRGGSFYTPIAGSLDTGFSPRPIFYGMMMANQFAGSTLIQCDFEVPGVNATAYAAKTQDGLRIALFNKDAVRDLTVQLKPGGKVSEARVWRLIGPTLDSTSGVTLAGAAIEAGSAWHPREESLKAGGDGVTLPLPKASALLAFVS